MVGIFIVSERLRFSDVVGPVPRVQIKDPGITQGDWSGYQRLKQAFTSWTRNLSKWWTRIEKPGSARKPEKAGKSLAEYKDEASYRLEVKERLALMEETLKRSQNQLDLEIQSKLRQKENQLNYEIEKAIAEKRKMLAEELAAFRGKTETEYLIRLTNLRFKLQLPGLPAEDQQRLQNEIASIEAEMRQKVEEKARELEAEATAFGERRRIAAAEEIKAYHQQLVFESELRFQEEKNRLEEDFLTWQRRREEEMEEN